jgi:SAM-dependent methyltransferase
MRKVTAVQRWFSRYALRHPSSVLAARYAELVSPASGQVVEVGCATGFLFGYYPDHVGHLVAVEPRVDYRDAAREAGRRVRFPVKVIDTGPAGTLPMATGSADVVVCCEVLCSVADLALTPIFTSSNWIPV